MNYWNFGPPLFQTYYTQNNGTHTSMTPNNYEIFMQNQ
jgi:hypothetical protein